MFDKLINRYVRHALTLGLGYATAKGVLDPETANQFVDATVQVVSVAAGYFGVTYLSKYSDKILLKVKGLF